MNGYFILEDGEQKGPFTFEELIENGLDVHTRISAPGATIWQDACDLPEFYPYFASHGIYLPTGDNLASFWWRLLAFIIDFIIVSFIANFFIAIFLDNGAIAKIQSLDEMFKLPAAYREKISLIVYGVFILYNLVGEISPLKGTPGKRLCGMVVVDVDGFGLSFPNSLLRSLGKAISVFFLGAGFLSVLWTEHRQALQDYIAKSYVVKRS